MAEAKTHKWKLDMKVVEGKEPLLAFAAIVVELDGVGPFIIKDLTVKRRKDGGKFVGMPAKKGTKKNAEGKDEWFDTAHPLTKEGRAAIGEIVLAEYNKRTGEKGAPNTQEAEDAPSFS